MFYRSGHTNLGLKYKILPNGLFDNVFLEKQLREVNSYKYRLNNIKQKNEIDSTQADINELFFD